MNIFNKFIHYFNPEGLENVTTPITNEAVFGLYYKELLIGKLKLNHGVWSFAYSQAFKEQKIISTLGAFPNVNQIYETEELWPFFTSRIPTPNQPVVQETIAKNKIDPNNTVSMLTNFGKRTITNPFELRVN